MKEDSWFRGALLSVLFVGGFALVAPTPMQAQFPGGDGPVTGPGECPFGLEWSAEAGGCIPPKPPCPEGEVLPGCGQPPLPPGTGGNTPTAPEPPPEPDCSAEKDALTRAIAARNYFCLHPTMKAAFWRDCDKAILNELAAIRDLERCEGGN